ncbi:MAG: FG-GAP repeat protein [Ignavibacteria bacterium]|nr:FG-GAP repeat protein [Ignavibacteria bacterium]
MGTTPGWSAEVNQASAYFGNSVSTAGDVNGDGYSDVIIGALEFDNGQINEGAAFLYHGSSSGCSAFSNWSTEGNQVDASFGTSVSSAGDVNGDGYSDVIIGSLFYDNGQTDEGRAYVYHGSASGLSVTSDWIAESNNDSSYFGISVSSAGDVNGDGYSDVIVGANGLLMVKLPKEQHLFIMDHLWDYLCSQTGVLKEIRHMLVLANQYLQREM